MTWTKDENTWLKGHAGLIGFYCSVCGKKFDPRLDNDWTTAEMHLLNVHRRLVDTSSLGAGVGGVIAQEEEGGSK